MGDALGQWGASLIMLGGLAYSIGGVIYALRWPDPSPKVRAGSQMHCGHMPLHAVRFAS